MPFYWGRQYECSACGAHLRKFRPLWKSLPRKLNEAGFQYPLERFETFNHKAFLCPSCNCSDRERLYALFLKLWIKQHKDTDLFTFVDFAPSLSLSTWLRQLSTVKYRSADLFRPNVDDKVDITNMVQYETNSIDAFMCSHVLEHIEDDHAAMHELYRVLKPGGFGIVMVPLIVGVTETHEDLSITDPTLRWKYFAQDDHVRLYGTEDFVRRLTDAGFQVVKLGVDFFGEEAFRLHGLAANSVLYVASKGDTFFRS